jgi:hypothetical protein
MTVAVSPAFGYTVVSTHHAGPDNIQAKFMQYGASHNGAISSLLAIWNESEQYPWTGCLMATIESRFVSRNFMRYLLEPRPPTRKTACDVNFTIGLIVPLHLIRCF